MFAQKKFERPKVSNINALLWSTQNMVRWMIDYPFKRERNMFAGHL